MKFSARQKTVINILKMLLYLEIVFHVLKLMILYKCFNMTLQWQTAYKKLQYNKNAMLCLTEINIETPPGGERDFFFLSHMSMRVREECRFFLSLQNGNKGNYCFANSETIFVSVKKKSFLNWK